VGLSALSATRKLQISKISADIARIEKSFFETDVSDLTQRYFMLRHKREHLLRSVVLELHLSIENIITGALGNALLKGRPIRSPSGHALRDLLEDEHSIGFRHKLLLARSMDLITRKEFADLGTQYRPQQMQPHMASEQSNASKAQAIQAKKAPSALQRHQSL
jgi:hypothetical protein